MKRLLLAATFAAAIARPAWADGTTDDVHCFILSIRMAAATDASVRTAGTLSSFFWLGRINGLGQDANLEKNIAAELPHMTGDYLQSEAARCSTQMIAIGRAEAKLGDDLQKLLAPPPSALPPPSPLPPSSPPPPTDAH